MPDALRSSANKIRDLNDAFRQTFAGGLVVLTDGVALLPENDRAGILRRVRTFQTFNLENDPFGEHDFGAIEHGGLNIFWKIDCYDRNLEFGSSDPTDPNVTTRVLTIMRAEEY